MPHVQKQLKTLELSKKTLEPVELEHKYTAGGFKPLPAFFVEGKGAKLWVRIKFNLMPLYISEEIKASC
jgi:ornithine--oxo-acid transaminase